MKQYVTVFINIPKIITNTSKIMKRVKYGNMSNIGLEIIYMVGQCQKRLKDTSKFNVSFIKNYNEESDVGYFFEADVQYLIFNILD